MEGNLQWNFKNCSHEGKVRHMEVRLEGCFFFFKKFCLWKEICNGTLKIVRMREKFVIWKSDSRGVFSVRV